MLQAIPQGVGLDGGVAQMVLQSGPIVKAVLTVLLLFSVFSWAVIAERSGFYRRARRADEHLARALRQAVRPSDLRSLADTAPTSPFAGLLRAAATELRAATTNPAHTSPLAGEDLDRALRLASLQEIARLERRLGFLATTGSVTPFIGLFGTVWGIMNAFRSIGVAGSANLATVAPGISEALVTTAAGLAAAIPAVIAYNHFVARVRGFRSELEGFRLEVERSCQRAARPGALAAPEAR
jgi:biopolymer transport protein TolQ